MGDPAWSPDGAVIAFACSNSICTIGADGSGLVNLTESSSQNDGYPTWSPDGSMIAYSCNGNICVMNADGSHAHGIQASDVFAAHLAWSPDGSAIAFTGEEGVTVSNIYLFDLREGSVMAITHSGDARAPSWSPDGSQIAFAGGDPRDNSEDVWVMHADGTSPRRLTSTTDRNEGEPAWSPDGRSVAFSAYQGRIFGHAAVYVIDLQGAQEARLSSAGRYPAPTWSPDASRIAFAG